MTPWPPFSMTLTFEAFAGSANPSELAPKTIIKHRYVKKLTSRIYKRIIVRVKLAQISKATKYGGGKKVQKDKGRARDHMNVNDEHATAVRM